MRKSDLIKQISTETGIIQSDVELVLQKAIETIRKLVSEGKEIRIQEFGVFKTRHRPVKVAYNLGGTANRGKKNPELMLLPARAVPHFTPSKQFLTVD